MIKIIIWGCNSFSEYLANLVEKTGVIQVEAFVEESVTASHFAGKPLYDAGDFAKRTSLADIPIILGSPRTIAREIFNRKPQVNFESIREFKSMLQRILSRGDITNPLLHPAALTEISPAVYQYKSLTFGLQGSGNTLVNNILHNIVKGYKKRFFDIKDPLTALLEKMCYEYTQMVHQMMIDVLHGCGGRDIHIIPWKVGTSHFNCIFNTNTIMSVFSLPTRDHIINHHCGYHQLPSIPYLRDLHAKGFHPFLIVRNPLDIILSMLNKRKGIDRESKEINWKLFHAISFMVINKLKNWHVAYQSLYILRYEDLIENPVAKITELMRILNVKPSRRAAQKIWDNIAFKPIAHAPKNNFWNGKKDKWLQYFQAEHLNLLKEMQIEDILLKYGYENALNVFKTLTDANVKQYTRPEVEQFESKTLFLPDENVETFEYLKRTHGETACEKVNDISCRCADESVRSRVCTVLSSPYISKVMSAGSLPQYKTVLS